MGRSAKDAAGEAVSVTETVTETQALQKAESNEGFAALLSPEMQNQLDQEFLELLHRVQTGFDAPVNATAIATGESTKGQPFDVIDALTISDYLDKQKGEIMTKHLFILEFPDGRVITTMQSDAPPRAAVARLFTVARMRGMKIVAGPYLFVQGPKKSQPQAPWIFEKQPGWRCVPA